MDDVKLQLENLYGYVGEVKKTIEENNINTVKVLTYLLNKTKEFDEALSKVNLLITDAKATICENKITSNKLDDSIKILQRQNTEFKNSINSIRTTSEKSINEANEKIDAMKSNLDDLNSRCISTSNYVIIDKNDPMLESMSKFRRRLYVIFLWRRIKAQERQAKLEAERLEALKKQQEEEQRRLEEQRRKEEEEKRRKEEEERKRQAADEIKKILNGNRK